MPKKRLSIFLKIVFQGIINSQCYFVLKYQGKLQTYITTFNILQCGHLSVHSKHPDNIQFLYVLIWACLALSFNGSNYVPPCHISTFLHIHIHNIKPLPYNSEIHRRMSAKYRENCIMQRKCTYWWKGTKVAEQVLLITALRQPNHFMNGRQYWTN